MIWYLYHTWVRFADRKIVCTCRTVTRVTNFGMCANPLCSTRKYNWHVALWMYLAQCANISTNRTWYKSNWTPMISRRRHRHSILTIPKTARQQPNCMPRSPCEHDNNNDWLCRNSAAIGENNPYCVLLNANAQLRTNRLYYKEYTVCLFLCVVLAWGWSNRVFGSSI